MSFTKFSKTKEREQSQEYLPLEILLFSFIFCGLKKKKKQMFTPT
jgi:hypothetical protein